MKGHLMSARTSNQLPPSSGLAILYALIGAYGLLFGLPMTLTGLFIGGTILVPALCHLALGIGFATVALGIARGRPMAYRLAIGLAALVALISVIAVVESAVTADPESSYFWIFMASFFSIVSVTSYVGFQRGFVNGDELNDAEISSEESAAPHR